MANNDERVTGLDDAASIIEMRQRHLDVALRMQRVAVRAIEELEQKLARGEPLNLSAEDAKTLLNASAKLERSALGEKEPADGDAPIPKAKKPN
jgi:hypothetical protein